MQLAAVLGDAIGEPVDRLEPLTGGASYDSYRVTTRSGTRLHARLAGDDDYGDRALSRAGLASEAEMLRRADAAGVPVPAVVAYLSEPEILISQWLDGESLGGRIARRDEFAPARAVFAKQCGDALGRVHSIPFEDLELERQSPVDFVTVTHQRYRELGVVRPLLDGVARHLIETAPEPSLDTLVHGDFRNGNLMVHPTAGILGVLDWELARIGDPMQDLGYLMLNSWRFGVPDREVGGCGSAAELFAAYSARTGVSVDPVRVRWWQAAGSFWWGVTCLLQSSRFDPERPDTIEFAAIGPRVSEAEVDCANLLLPEFQAQLDQVDEAEHRWTPPLAAALRTALGRSDYRSRVLASMTETIERESRLGWSAGHLEMGRLAELLGEPGSLTALRRQMADELWAGERSVTDPAVAEHLTRSALNDLLIDQPSYRAPPLTNLLSERLSAVAEDE